MRPLIMQQIISHHLQALTKQTKEKPHEMQAQEATLHTVTDEHSNTATNRDSPMTEEQVLVDELTTTQQPRLCSTIECTPEAMRGEETKQQQLQRGQQRCGRCQRTTGAMVMAAEVETELQTAWGLMQAIVQAHEQANAMTDCNGYSATLATPLTLGNQPAAPKTTDPN